MSITARFVEGRDRRPLRDLPDVLDDFDKGSLEVGKMLHLHRFNGGWASYTILAIEKGEIWTVTVTTNPLAKTLCRLKKPLAFLVNKKPPR